jgi:TetR/AcrR family transcriptional repressor of nem operon
MARPPGFDRQQVLSAVERQFRKTGYAGTSLDDLCAVTGLGRGSLYGAFGDKRSLFLQALKAYCERSEDELLTALAGPDDEAIDRLQCFLMASGQMPFADQDRLGCMVGKFAGELASLDELAAARIRQDMRVLHEWLAECVRAAQRHGDLHPEVSPAEIAGLLLTIARGLDVVIQAGAEADTVEAIARRAFASLPLTAAGLARTSAATAHPS